MASRGHSSGGLGKFLLGFLSALLLAAVTIIVYFKLGNPPVAVADKPLPVENAMLVSPTEKRIGREMTGAPMASSEEVFKAGAEVYNAECASCHGKPDVDVAFASHMHPLAPQFWRGRGRDNAIGVGYEESGRVYWKIANGIRLSGMPSYSHILTDEQMWQLTLMLKHANRGLPESAMAILKQ